MAFLNTNSKVAGLIAQQEANVSGLGLQKTLARLASGLRIPAGADDPAGLLIADGLRAQIRTLQQAVRNANDGVALLQTADSALDGIQNLLIRAESILTQAATAGNPEAFNVELRQLLLEIERTGGATQFNGLAVFSDTVRSIYVGDAETITGSSSRFDFTIGALSTAGLGITEGVAGTGTALAVDIAAATSIEALLLQVDAARETIAQRRGDLEAQGGGLERSVHIITARIQNLTAAESQIRDADIAQEITNLARFQILNESGLAALAQANQNSLQVLSLFR